MRVRKMDIFHSDVKDLCFLPPILGSKLLQIKCSFFLAIFPPTEKPGYHYLNCVLNLKQVEENLYETKKLYWMCRWSFLLNGCKSGRWYLILKQFAEEHWKQLFHRFFEWVYICRDFALQLAFPTSSKLKRNGLRVVIFPKHKKLKWKMSWNLYKRKKEQDYCTF